MENVYLHRIRKLFVIILIFLFPIRVFPDAKIDLSKFCKNGNNCQPREWYYNCGDRHKEKLDFDEKNKSWEKFFFPSNIKNLVNSKKKFLDCSFFTKFDYSLEFKKNIIQPGLLLHSIGPEFSIFINDHLVARDGKVQNGVIAYERFLRNVVYPIKEEILKEKENILFIRLRGDPRYVLTGFYYKGNYEIGETIDLLNSRKEGIHFVLYTLYFFVGLYHLFLFHRRSQDYFNLYYGLFSIFIFVYFSTRSNYILEFPISTSVISKVEHFSLYNLPWLIVAFFESLFFSKLSRTSKVYGSLNIFLSILAILLPSYLRTYVLRLWQLCAIFSILYSVKILYTAIRQKIQEAKTLFAAAIILGIAYGTDLIDSVFFHQNLHISNHVFFVFILGIAVLLADRFVRLNKEKDDLFEKTERRTKELYCLYNITHNFSSFKSKSKLYQNLVNIIKKTWPYSKKIEVHFRIHNQTFTTGDAHTDSSIQVPLKYGENTIGQLEIKYYSEALETNKLNSNEPQNFLNTVGNILGNLVQKVKADEEIIIANTVFENAIEGVLITNTKGEIEYVNPSFTFTTGYLPNELLGKKPNVFKSNHYNQEFYQDMWRGILKLGKWHGEIWNRKKNGEIFPSLLSITSIPDSDGEIMQYAAVYSDITEMKKSEEKIRFQAYHDALTGLPNRTLFYDRLQNALLHAKRHKAIVAVLFVDLDNFKKVNDTLGHSAGDELIKSVAQRLQDSVREMDTVARLSGDEFILLIDDLDSKEQATLVANRIIESIQKPYPIHGKELQVGASMGVTFYPEDGTEVESLVKNADIAMYKAKELGKNAYQLFTNEMKESAYKKVYTENELRKATQRNELTLLYQPIISIKNQTIVNMESLLRWNSKNLGEVLPSEFIPIAEESGLILDLGEWVLTRACYETHNLQKKGFDNLTVSVNISPKQFGSNIFCERVETILFKSGLPPKTLVLELTESIVMENVDRSIAYMNSLNRIGVQFALDDFGTGQTSLSYLKKFPLQKLKIDKSFIHNLGNSHVDRQIVQATIAMGQSLGLVITAEGVETRKQLDFLINEGCDEIQGYYFSKPISLSSFKSFYELNKKQINL